MKRPTKFEIRGLFGSKDVSLRIAGDALILVGPNGIGKSSVANIFYFFVSRQWTRLLGYTFDSVSLWFGKEEIRAERSEISGLSEYVRVMEDIAPSSRTGMLLQRIKNANLIEEFVANRRLTLRERQRLSHELNISPDEVRFLQSNLFRRYANSASDDDLFSQPRLALENALSEYIPNRTLYLPTYRRIEKDLKEIFPDLEERFRGHMEGRSALHFSRSSTHYIDLVSFGMEDVRTNVEARTRALRDYSLEQFNALSARYLKDVIKGTADQYSPAQIRRLSEESLAAILNRVSEQVLSAEDKSLLRTKITEMKGKRKSQLEVNDLYLAHYFSRLIKASAEISKKEVEIAAFVGVCNAYLKPGKSMVYDETKFSLQIVDENGHPIDLSVLSSGEKQVVSLFSHLYLDEARDQIVIIDEPELSLSVPWQKRFLPDILESNHCSFVLSVTHSPFIYQNRLEEFAVDLRRHITSEK